MCWRKMCWSFRMRNWTYVAGTCMIKASIFIYFSADILKLKLTAQCCQFEIFFTEGIYILTYFAISTTFMHTYLGSLELLKPKNCNQILWVRFETRIPKVVHSAILDFIKMAWMWQQKRTKSRHYCSALWCYSGAKLRINKAPFM